MRPGRSDERPPDHDRGRDPPGDDPHLPRDRGEAGRHRRAWSSSASSAAACRSPTASPARSRARGRRDPGRGARHHVLPRRPVARRPAADRQGHRRCRSASTAGRSCSSTTSCTRAARSAPRWTPSSTSGGRRRSGWPCSSTAATASCRSAPTTSARTCRRRARRSSGSSSRRSTARTASRSSGCSSRPRAGRGASSRRVTTEVVADAGAARPSRQVDVAPESQPVGWRHRHLLDVDVLSRGRHRARHAHDRRDARGPGAPDRQGPGAARPQRDDPVLRGLDADPRQLRGRGQEPVGRRRQHRGGRRRRWRRASRSSTRCGRSRRSARRCSSCATRRRGAPYLAAEVFGGSVLNGGDGWHAHPTQALLDLYTLRSRTAGRRRSAAARS